MFSGKIRQGKAEWIMREMEGRDPPPAASLTGTYVNTYTHTHIHLHLLVFIVTKLDFAVCEGVSGSSQHGAGTGVKLAEGLVVVSHGSARDDEGLAYGGGGCEEEEGEGEGEQCCCCCCWCCEGLHFPCLCVCSKAASFACGKDECDGRTHEKIPRQPLWFYVCMWKGVHVSVNVNRERRAERERERG